MMGSTYNTTKSDSEKLSRSDVTKKSLIQAGIRLFSQYGYDSTSTRMIAKEAHANLSAISFHFNGKEQLYAACLEEMARWAALFYEDSLRRCDALLQKESIAKSEVYKALSELISLQIKYSSEQPYRNLLQLIYWEQTGLHKNHNIISPVIFDRVEGVMTKLILSVTDLSQAEAIIASRLLNGSIISFGERSVLLKNLLDENISDEKDLPMWIQNEMSRTADIFLRALLKM